MLQLSRYSKHATVNRTVPTTKNYPAQNINNAEAVKPWPKENEDSKAEHKFRRPVRPLLKSFLSPWKQSVGLNRSSSKCFFDFPSLSAHKILLELTHVSTLIYYYPTNPFFWPKQATLFPDTLCLTGCYPPNKQGSSFV